MGVKKSCGSNGSTGATKPFQLLNSVITTEDITPLAKTQGPTTSTDAVLSTSDSDLLFSPLNSGVDDEEEDEYDHELLNPVYFGAQYPKQFLGKSGGNCHNAVESRKNSVSAFSLKDLLGNTTNEDFWKEVDVTNEEAIYSSLPTPQATERSTTEEYTSSSFDEFITEDLSAPPPTNTSSSSPPQWEEDYKIKLLCYRDATGNLRLRTQEENYSVCKPEPLTKNRIRKNQRGGKGKNKLLKNAIRRKSGVREMVSTGIGIGEFML